MTDRRLRRLAVAVWAVSVGLVLAGFGLLFVAPNSVASVGGVTLMFSTVGVLVVARAQARNRIGWILLAIGACYAYLTFFGVYGSGSVTHHWFVPASRVVLWIALWSWTPALGVTATFLFLLFPDGRLPSRGWRWLGWLSGIAIAAAVLGFAVSSGWEVLRATPGQFARLMRGGAEVTGLGAPMASVIAFEGGVLLAAVCMAGCVAAAVVRFRRAAGRERRQLQWFLYGAVTLALGAAGSFLPGTGSTIVPVIGFVWFVACLAVAMLRHRLYDIDRIINRTLVYAALTAVLVGIYAGLVLGLGAIAGSGNAVVVAGSTLVVAALFNPLRRRVQVLIDRRFYRRKYDAERTPAAFGARLRDEVDLDELRAHVLSVVTETIQPAHASVWLARSRP